MQGRDGRSKGHGIVLFATSDDADKAQEMFNGYEWHGRPLEVREEIDGLADKLDKKLLIDTDRDESNDSEILASPPNGEGASEDLALPNGGGVTDSTPVKGAQERTIHVGNIPFRVRWQDLKDLFRKAGHVVRADVALGPDGRSRGFGTVIYSSVDEAMQSIRMFDQHHWQDRVIQVQEDRSGMENGRHHDRGNGHGHIPMQHHAGPHFRNPYPMNYNVHTSRQVFVGNIPFQCQWQDLKDLFRKAGNIIRADVAHGFDGRSRGFGSVLFATTEDAKTAISMFDSYEYNGRTLRVHYDRYGHVGHGPMHGNIGHMMHPHMAHHPHLHPHQPHHHPHRIHHLHPQHNHGFHGNFHQPPMMPLSSHPMVHGGGHVPFNLAPLPLFANRNFSPLDSASNDTTDFATPDGSVLTNAALHPPGISGMTNTIDRDSSATTFDPSPSNATAIAVASPLISTSAASAAAAHGSFSSPGVLPRPDPSSPSEQYPFLPHLGPIGKPNSANSSQQQQQQQQQQLPEQSNSGILPGSNSGNLPSHSSSVGMNDTDDDDFGPRSIGNPYHFGNGVGDDESAYTPRFYMYPGHHHSQYQSQQQPLQQGEQQSQTQQQHLQQPPLQQQQQAALAGYLPPYPDLYSHEHLVHGRGGIVGGLGANSLSHGYPNQPEWMGHPSTFMMGPPQHMYGTLPFGQYGHYSEVDDREELSQQQQQQQDGY
ncbi:hypothetical protein BGZ95_004811 [Linnemannia exigua]|uniref:RRM domain-containing protein n=1 Tax=Linnemannia exigua TaxID=604196 RepID=A0AAD4DJD4_9FUNG|nr:hypothetical protein BGZ95_004811 [Linnemannia exigua]